MHIYSNGKYRNRKEYDGNRNLVASYEYSSGKLKTKYKYDWSGTKINRYRYSNRKLKYKDYYTGSKVTRTLKYDQKGKVISDKSASDDLKFGWKKEVKNGNGTKIYYKNSKINKYYCYQNGKVAEYLSYYSNGAVKEKIKYHKKREK